MTYASEAGDFSIALGGDCLLTRRLAVYDEPAFLALAQLFRGCDAGFVNLETVVRRWHEGAPGITRGTYMTTPPELLDDLKWFGINMVGCANNHAFDY
ncbi:MAG TPA: CapA family protein, partial [Xanthobacteraceae bacterium]